MAYKVGRERKRESRNSSPSDILKIKKIDNQERKLIKSVKYDERNKNKFVNYDTKYKWVKLSCEKKDWQDDSKIIRK